MSTLLITTDLQEAPSETNTRLTVERLMLEPYNHYTFFRGTREAFDAQFSKIITRYHPEMLAKFPTVNVDEDTYGFIGGIVMTTSRENVPCFWVALPGARHWHLEQLIKKHGTPEEASKLMQHRRGFMTNNGRWVSRLAARSIACEAGQLLASAVKRNELYSDDIW